MRRGLGAWPESFAVGAKSLPSQAYINWDPMEQLRREIKDLSALLAMERAVNTKPWRFFRWVCVLGLIVAVVVPALIGIGTRFFIWALGA